jgi:hypothetical protein
VDEKGGSCSTHGGDNVYKIVIKILEGKRQLEDLDIGGRIILE